MQITNPSHEISLPREGLAKLPAVMNATGLSRSTLYARVKTGGFPAPVKLGERSVAWSVESVRAWIAERIAASPNNRQSGRLLIPMWLSSWLDRRERVQRLEHERAQILASNRGLAVETLLWPEHRKALRECVIERTERGDKTYRGKFFYAPAGYTFGVAVTPHGLAALTTRLRAEYPPEILAHDARNGHSQNFYLSGETLVSSFTDDV